MRLGMESVRCLQTFWSLSVHQISLMICFSSSKVVGFDVETFFLISVRKFSIGLRSGEFPAYLSIVTFLVWNQFMTDLALWHGAESFWKVVHPWMLMKFSTVKLRYFATSLLCHPRYYTTFDRHQLNSIENIFTMPPLTLATMPHEVLYCSVLTKQ